MKQLRSRKLLSRRRPSRGLTLFELLLALAIFLASVAALAHLLDAGSRAAIQGRLQSRAILRAESKLDEVLSGVEPLEAVADVPFDDDEDWRWSLRADPGPLAGLVELELTVTYVDPAGRTSTSYQLTRYMRHPEWFRGRAVRPAVRNSPVILAPPAAQPEDRPAEGDRDP